VIPGLKDDPDDLERRFGPETGRRMWQIAGGAADFVFEMIARHKISCHARQCGWISAAPTAAAMETLRARVEQWQRRGAPVELLDRQRVAELTGTTCYAGGMLDRRAGALQPLAYARGLARAAQGAGASVHGGSPATAIEWRAGAGASACQGLVTASRVILPPTPTGQTWSGLPTPCSPCRATSWRQGRY
jgi:glycine/D-amino acid oxidase-like deaminating enzyme